MKKKKRRTAYDEPFMSLNKAAKHLRLGMSQIRPLVGFDKSINRPSPDSEFPNAYKATGAVNSPIRIPVRDIVAFKVRQAGRLGDKYVYDLAFMDVKQVAEHLRLSTTQVRKLLDFNPTTRRAGQDSEFPNAYKATTAKNSPIRIPVYDVEQFKLRQSGATTPL